jgi:hypothetical protein
VPSIVIVRRANAAFVSFSKRWIVHEFMIMDRLQSALIIDVTFSVPNIGGNRRCCGSDISLFVSAERFFQSRVPCERFIFEPARIKFGAAKAPTFAWDVSNPVVRIVNRLLRPRFSMSP